MESADWIDPHRHWLIWGGIAILAVCAAARLRRFSRKIRWSRNPQQLADRIVMYSLATSAQMSTIMPHRYPAFAELVHEKPNVDLSLFFALIAASYFAAPVEACDAINSPLFDQTIRNRVGEDGFQKVVRFHAIIRIATDLNYSVEKSFGAEIIRMFSLPCDSGPVESPLSGEIGYAIKRLMLDWWDIEAKR